MATGSTPSQDGEEDEGNASEGTIYESIENLVMQFDATMRDATQALGQFGQNMKGGGGGGKKRKKKSLVRQHSLFSIKGERGREGIVFQHHVQSDHGTVEVLVKIM